MILIENLVKRYKDVLALDHLNLHIEQGEVFGFLGPNGSGKTTAINCMLALLTYDRGRIELFGQEMRPDSYDLKRRIGVVPQEVAVIDQLTVRENIDYFCGLYVPEKAKRRQLVEEAMEFTDLQEFQKKRPKQLSGGMLRRLNIACGIAHKPELVIMDEPTVAVDPQSRNKILEGILELNRQGSTIIYTSHYMEEVEQICSRISIMDHGRSIAQGTKEELKELIRTGETITIEDVMLTAEQIREMEIQPYVHEVDYKEQTLTVRCRKGSQNLVKVLSLLEEEKVGFGRVYSELPTLNDVFLEITGKQLRD